MSPSARPRLSASVSEGQGDVRLGLPEARAVWPGHEGPEAKGVAEALGMGPEGGLAVASQRLEHPPLGSHAGGRRGVVQAQQQGPGLGVVRAAFDAQRTLSYRGQRDLRGEDLGGPTLEAEAHQAGACQDDGVALAGVDLAQPGVDVAPQRDDLEVGPPGLEGNLAAQAGGTHPRPFRQGVERPVPGGDQDVARVLATGDAGDEQPLGQGCPARP